jgi:hypothetical protein
MSIVLPDPGASTVSVDPLLAGAGGGLFIGLLILGIVGLPLLASVIRRIVPNRRMGARAVEPMSFGDSQKSRRSPRHAVLLHRGLVGAFFMALLALLLVPAVASLSDLGPAAIPAAIAFVLPTLLVTIHARRRSLRE